MYNQKKTYTNEITQAIKKYIRFNGGYAFRVNSIGVFDPVRQVYRRNNEKGISDLICCYKGLFIAIEIKQGYDKQSEWQKVFEQNVNKAGGIYIIVKSFEQFKNFFDNLKTKQ